MFNKRSAFILLGVALLLNGFLITPAEAGVKKFVKDTISKVKGFFGCSSHENEDDHNLAIGDTDNDVETTLSSMRNTEKTTSSSVNNKNVNEAPEIDLRQGEGIEEIDPSQIKFESRILVDVPRNCPEGTRLAHDNKCRPLF